MAKIVKGQDAKPPRYGPGGAPIWLVRWRDGAGRKRMQTCYSEQEAKRVHAEKEQEQQGQAQPTPEQPEIRLVDFATRWLDTVDVEARTRRGYRQLWACYIEPEFPPTMKR